jgi:hypothetical protein
MNAQQLIELYSNVNNSNIVINVNFKDKEFVSTTLVNVSAMSESEKDLVSSQPNDVLQALLQKILDYVQENYKETSFEYEKKSYEIVKIDNETKSSEKLSQQRRIFCYVSFTQPLVRKTKKELSEENLEKIKIQIKDTFDFIPPEEDKKNVLEKLVPAIEEVVVSQSGEFLEQISLNYFKNWYLCVVDKPTSGDEIFYTALNTILRLKSKKGSWIEKADSALNIQPDPLVIKKPVSYYLQSVAVVINSYSDKKAIFEDSVQSFENKIKDAEFNLQSVEASVVEVSGFSLKKYEVAMYARSFLDETSNEKKYLVGFTQNIIDAFPDLTATDYKNFEPKGQVTFDDLEDMEKTIKSLEDIIDKKVLSLGDLELEISNYDIEEYVKDFKDFATSIRKNVVKQNLDAKSPIKISFAATKCPEPNANDPLAIQKQAIECKKVFVEGQTNLKFVNSVSIKDEKTQTLINNVSPVKIDEQISAYLLANSKQIVSQGNSYSPKEFFSTLIYQKTKFDKKAGFSTSVFFDAAKQSLQQSFIVSSANLIKFSKIKDNIVRKNAANKNISQIVRDILSDIRSVKRLYEEIMYRYDVKDLADEVLACYANQFLAENPIIATFIDKVKTIFNDIVKFLDAENQTFSLVTSCLGIVVPQKFGQVSGQVFTNPTDFVREQIIKKSVEASANFTSLDNFAAFAIRCFDKFYDPTEAIEQYRKTLKDYDTIKSAVTIAIEQYKLLKTQAKLYRSNPGTKQALKKKEKGFLEKAIENGWILLQKQLEREAEKLLVEFIKSKLKELLDSLKQDCKGEENNNKPIGNPGDLNLANGLDLNDSVIKLLNFLSNNYSPDKLCSIFYGTADNDIYEQVAGIIKQQFIDLYSEQPIKYKNVILSNEALSTPFFVKNFLLLFSVEFPDLTVKKCDNYFQNLTNLPLELDDDEKCIDFSEKYKNDKIASLRKRGFTEEQAKKIVEAQLASRRKKYEQIFNEAKVDIYDELTKEFDEKKVPVADFVKDKVEKQLKQLVNSVGSFISLEKTQLLSLPSSFNQQYIINKEDINVDSTFVSIKAFNVSYQQSSGKNNSDDLLPFNIDFEPIHYYEKKYPFLPYAVLDFSNEYFKKQYNLPAFPILAPNILIQPKLQEKGILFKVFENIFQEISTELNTGEKGILIYHNKNVFEKFIIKIIFDIVQDYNQQVYDFYSTPFKSNQILSDMKELINFEE